MIVWNSRKYGRRQGIKALHDTSARHGLSNDLRREATTKVPGLEFGKLDCICCVDHDPVVPRCSLADGIGHAIKRHRQNDDVRPSGRLVSTLPRRFVRSGGQAGKGFPREIHWRPVARPKL